MLNKKIIGGIIFTSSEKDLRFFNITLKNLPQPNIKYRMLDMDKKIYLIEFVLKFSNGKTLFIHLDPCNSTFRKFLQINIKSKFNSFHFFNIMNGRSFLRTLT